MAWQVRSGEREPWRGRQAAGVDLGRQARGSSHGMPREAQRARPRAPVMVDDPGPGQRAATPAADDPPPQTSARSPFSWSQTRRSAARFFANSISISLLLSSSASTVS